MYAVFMKKMHVKYFKYDDSVKLCNCVLQNENTVQKHISKFRV
jgi:hypothetical protein